MYLQGPPANRFPVEDILVCVGYTDLCNAMTHRAPWTWTRNNHSPINISPSVLRQPRPSHIRPHRAVVGGVYGGGDGGDGGGGGGGGGTVVVVAFVMVRRIR